MANEVPYAPSQTRLTKFLSHIQSAGVPTTVNGPYLQSVGYKGGNDLYIVSVLKFIGLLSSKGAPTDAWRNYRDTSRAPSVLALAVRTGYAALFDLYPDAHQKDEEAIRNWVRSATSYDDTKVGFAVSTFKTLCSLAAWDTPESGATLASPAESADSPAVPPTTKVPIASAPAPTNALGTPSININIELHLPVDTDGDTYDKFFEAMKKHLFPDAPGK
ncbi:DUF5343 domain-containing protein [Herbiconiux sp. 11R-BC]|uniref:DUF5343 domain-containing protein n=1 Tax=Herbiconiux sp. 11R-BC TaxID=3111637 RepID=UPI003C016A5F